MVEVCLSFDCWGLASLLLRGAGQARKVVSCSKASGLFLYKKCLGMRVNNRHSGLDPESCTFGVRFLYLIKPTIFPAHKPVYNHRSYDNKPVIL